MLSQGLNNTVTDPTLGIEDNIILEHAIRDLDWKKTMEEEMQSIWKNETWLLKPLPPGKKAITCKWVFKLKPGIGNKPDRKKVRLVARGFEQRKDIDFLETFAPVIKWTTLHTTIALAASKNWHMYITWMYGQFIFYGLLKE
jgi:hypothetical protein